MPSVRPFLVTALFSIATAALLPGGAGAQQVFRIVGPDGRVTFSDQPSSDPKAKVAPTVPLSAGAGSGAGMPFELQQVTNKYPVTLYTSTNCGACGSGRSYLTSRGIPFSEKTITTPEDAAALQRIAGDPRVPLLTVGGQQIHGYSDVEWGQFLDAAGYPARSALPGSWRNPAPSPLVAVQRVSLPAPAPVREAAEPVRPTPNLPQEPADNPAGIKF